MGKRKSEERKQLSYRIHTRISKEKYEELVLLLSQSKNIKSLSALLRHILDGNRILVRHQDITSDKMLAELGAVRRELHSIGININQVTKRFHAEKLPESRIARVLDLTRFYQQAEEKLTEVIAIISKISAKWLPE
ncbi:hypothetical protein [Pedobacter borealis]|uniref:hypothetical protein n=1 Tax=Pedobacter borealis TaxID=475254 RepID=UPI000493AA65|nr:hypothetical protein [Pedobacter borealis]